MSRPPIPTEIKRDKGTLNNTRRNKNEIQLTTDKIRVKPTPPDNFNSYALNEWETIWAFLIQYGIAATVDISLVGAYCREMGLYLESKDELEKSGKVFKSNSGYPMPSPYIAIANKALENARKLAVEFGFTPSSRSKVSAPPNEAESPLMALLRSKPVN